MAVGLILTQIIVDYWVTPLMMKKELHISFLQVTLALLIWGFLPGPRIQGGAGGAPEHGHRETCRGPGGKRGGFGVSRR